MIADRDDALQEARLLGHPALQLGDEALERMAIDAGLAEAVPGSLERFAHAVERAAIDAARGKQ